MRARYFYGWNIVAATFVMAMFSFGLGFYGLTVYVATLERQHGWSAAAVSAPVTVYYVAGALLTMVIGGVYERLGPRVVVTTASLAMASGVAALGWVTDPRWLYPVFLVMALAWGAMSGAAINVVLAPWFQRRRRRRAGPPAARRAGRLPPRGGPRGARARARDAPDRDRRHAPGAGDLRARPRR
jgi:MFS family permease